MLPEYVLLVLASLQHSVVAALHKLVALAASEAVLGLEAAGVELLNQ